MAVCSPNGRAGRVFVRLSEVPPPVRASAAERVIRGEKLRGLDALELRMAAVCPRDNPGVFVDRETARRVLRA